ncbi:hypothetical protein [Koleobacter methoxysyntrophicus]|nr:hypothetical protein [Koleobacter methoxysyntrophicus]
MGKYRIVLEEIDKDDKVANRLIVTEVNSVKTKPVADMTEEDKQAWLDQIEQNAVDAANALKKTLRSKKSGPKKSN